MLFLRRKQMATPIIDIPRSINASESGMDVAVPRWEPQNCKGGTTLYEYDIPTGRSGSPTRFQPFATIPVQPADCVKVGIAAVDIGAVVKAILYFGRFFQPAGSVGMRFPAVPRKCSAPPRYRSFDRLLDDDEQCFVFFSIQPCLPFRPVSAP